MTDEITVVGVFGNEDAARAALPKMTKAGFAPDSVGVVSDNVRQAREVAGSFSPRGAVVGAAVGLVVAVVLGLIVRGQTLNDAAAFPLAALLVIAGGAIGALAGRARAFQARDYGKYERAVDMGETLVSIRCEPGRRDEARRALEDAGASAVRVEDTAEAV